MTQIRSAVLIFNAVTTTANVIIHLLEVAGLLRLTVVRVGRKLSYNIPISVYIYFSSLNLVLDTTVYLHNYEAL